MKTLPRVLIVEDDPDTRSLMAAIFDHWGWLPIQADTYEEGLAVVMTDCPDLVMLDLCLPGGDGVDVLRALTTLFRPPPIIVATGRSDDQLIEVHTLKPFAVLRKPVLEDDLRSLVAQVEARLNEANP